MPSSSRPASLFRQLLLIAALVILVRAPFLIQGERFFDSDEAVEGLMARHVLAGEFPAFVWGQRYKGVPEVYLAAAVFAVTGSNVVALKSVTLACFALFVCLQFVLVRRLFSGAIAWLSTAFLIAGPPSLVFWSLSASAEIVMTMLAGTVMCLGVDVWRRTGSRPALMAACAAVGFGLWVHQYIVYYVVALGLAIWHGLPRRDRLLSQFLEHRGSSRWVHLLTIVLTAAGVLYVALGTLAFITGGFDIVVLDREVGVRHAQKLWYIAFAFLLLAGGIRLLSVMTRAGARTVSLVWGAAAAFAVGHAPALAARATGGGAPPIGRTDLAGVAAAISPLARDIVPIVTGFKSPDTGWLGAPVWIGLVLVFALVASLAALRERPFTPFFHYLLLTTPVVFLFSGAFVDAQSYRYLMPAWGALAVVVGTGVWWTFQRSRVAGTAAFLAVLTLFSLQQRSWYRQLPDDVQSRALIACLERAGVRVASADYWLSYKLTFLSDERLIVAPDGTVDRYPPYTDQVRSHPEAPRIPDKMMGLPCGSDTPSSR
jgi:hypothetical protein